MPVAVLFVMTPTYWDPSSTQMEWEMQNLAWRQDYGNYSHRNTKAPLFMRIVADSENILPFLHSGVQQFRNKIKKVLYSEWKN